VFELLAVGVKDVDRMASAKEVPEKASTYASRAAGDENSERL
jgi:hypothetical protein